jgi:protein required for attachment to host cells
MPRYTVSADTSCLFVKKEKRMQTTWVIAADSSRARIFELSSGDKLQEIEDMINPEGRQQDREVQTDADGRFGQGANGGSSASTPGPGARGNQANTAEPQQTIREHDVEMFTKQVVRYIDHARTEHRFDKLRVIAAPKMLGLIRQNLSKESQKMVEEEIPKNIAGLEGHQVEQYLRTKAH